MGFLVEYLHALTDGRAGEGERNVAVRCEVSARPALTALFWIIDLNGTTVTEGQVVNEYWTLVTDAAQTRSTASEKW